MTRKQRQAIVTKAPKARRAGILRKLRALRKAKRAAAATLAPCDSWLETQMLNAGERAVCARVCKPGGTENLEVVFQTAMERYCAGPQSGRAFQIVQNVWQEHHPQITAICARHCTDGPNVVSEVRFRLFYYLEDRALTKPSALTEEPEVKALYYKFARNLARDFGRKERKASPLAAVTGLDDGAESAENAFGNDQEHTQKLERLLSVACLSELESTCVLLRFIDDLSPEEIAEHLNRLADEAGVRHINAGTVSVRISRGIAKLRKAAGVEPSPKSPAWKGTRKKSAAARQKDK
jgi:DNA-directed RNA polymerase specialized sigma24 family protein